MSLLVFQNECGHQSIELGWGLLLVCFQSSSFWDTHHDDYIGQVASENCSARARWLTRHGLMPAFHLTTSLYLCSPVQSASGLVTWQSFPVVAKHAGLP